MKRIGITGQAGFIGTHLFNYLSLKKDEFVLVPFFDEFFNDDRLLNEWAAKTDVIVHLAGVNRHNDPEELYKINIRLVNQIINAAEQSQTVKQIIFSSSIQEEYDNLYGKSKKKGRKLIKEWAIRCNNKMTGLIIPNVFGPFGRPFYNSVVATFCHQVTHNEQPRIDKDSLLKLIYVGELVDIIYKIITQEVASEEYLISHTAEINVTELLNLINGYRTLYLQHGVIPELHSKFEINLFNTFRSFINLKEYFPFTLVEHSDNRGAFVETIKSGLGGQTSFSTTKPGITRGDHFHTRKIERFIVVKGEALIQLRQIGTQEIINLKLSGTKPAYVDMPVWVTHNITNIGSDELLTMFWINEFYNPEDPDTFFEKVEQ